MLTIALIEGSNITSLDSSGLYDPYVVFTCNGKTRTSSVKLQESDPQWNGGISFICMVFFSQIVSICHIHLTVLLLENLRRDT